MMVEKNSLRIEGHHGSEYFGLILFGKETNLAAYRSFGNFIDCNFFF